MEKKVDGDRWMNGMRERYERGVSVVVLMVLMV